MLRAKLLVPCDFVASYLTIHDPPHYLKFQKHCLLQYTMNTKDYSWEKNMCLLTSISKISWDQWTQFMCIGLEFLDTIVTCQHHNAITWLGCRLPLHHAYEDTDERMKVVWAPVPHHLSHAPFSNDIVVQNSQPFCVLYLYYLIFCNFQVPIPERSDRGTSTAD